MSRRKPLHRLSAATINRRRRELARSLLVTPLIGLVLGCESRGLRTHLIDHGFDDQFASDLNRQLGHGQSAIVLITDATERDRVLSALAPHGGTLLRTTVSIEADVLPLVCEPAGADAE
jgi:uncharacterized membrane protein